MLEPREADIPFLFLVLVVLPLVAYILLGKWSEAAKKRERISLLAQLAAEEAHRAEALSTTYANPALIVSSNTIHVCARCHRPATTRCSRCKAVRYCSGKCQIIHWRQVHKQECQQSETTSSCASPKAISSEVSFTERVSMNNHFNSVYLGCNSEQAVMNGAPCDSSVHHLVSSSALDATSCTADDAAQEAMLWRRNTDKQVLRKSNREMLRRHDTTVLDSSKETSGSGSANLASFNLPNADVNGLDTASTMHETHQHLRPNGNMFGSRSKSGSSSSFHAGKNGIYIRKIGKGPTFSDEIVDPNSHCKTIFVDGSVNADGALNSLGSNISKSSKFTMKVSGGQSYTDIERRGQIADGPKVSRMRDTIPAPGSNGVTSISLTGMMGLKKAIKLSRQDTAELNGIRKNIRMLFPYEEFMKIFNCEVVNLSPRGLLNCGNSCYANAVLQCLTCTKPLIIFLLQRSHSRDCCVKGWCIMCELEQYVMMLRERGGPLSPSGILLHMRKSNCQICDGSQEDAHEFLRLLVASMQSICLEGLGGEDKVNPRLQETTFIQHTFGGRLRSKVECLRCHRESERYENIMDLTLEIFGWVESLEDALTQFTSPEELDGENMYRCGRCATYVRARKQLSIHEAPNILTIVLKRFQEGKYGKINKCITFPDVLDMIPFMTGMGDIPPLYTLYAVVVHLDTLNASFSGHYVAYVKDLRGSWFRIDDTEVHPAPMSQVMSEGAYILFYKRSCPRPRGAFYEKAIQQQIPVSAGQHTSVTQKPSRHEQSKSRSQVVGLEPAMNLKSENGILRTGNGSFAELMEFSDATSSDWSLFTSSDEASFTTESTRDSFSTVDYTDACNFDTFSSVNNLCASESSSQNTLCSRTFSTSKLQTGFLSEERGCVLELYLSTQPPEPGKKGILNRSSMSQLNSLLKVPAPCL